MQRNGPRTDARTLLALGDIPYEAVGGVADVRVHGKVQVYGADTQPKLRVILRRGD
jgi:hypothetical protein